MSNNAHANTDNSAIIERLFAEYPHRWATLPESGLIHGNKMKHGQEVCGANVKNGTLTDTFIDMALKLSSFEDVGFDHASFGAAFFDCVTFKRCNFNAVRFANYEFTPTTINRCTFIGCDFTGIEFESTYFSRCEFINCKFGGANGSSFVTFSDCVFRGSYPDSWKARSQHDFTGKTVFQLYQGAL